MTSTAEQTAAPDWVLRIMREIDTLTFGPGFAAMGEDTEMYFGTAHLVGVEAIKAFFVKIDEPLNISHEILEFWTAPGGVHLLRGEATMAKKSAPDTVVHAPFMHIYYTNEANPLHINTIRITAGPLETDAVM